jgi:hypothetical protein
MIFQRRHSAVMTYANGTKNQVCRKKNTTLFQSKTLECKKTKKIVENYKEKTVGGDCKMVKIMG